MLFRWRPNLILWFGLIVLILVPRSPPERENGMRAKNENDFLAPAVKLGRHRHFRRLELRLAYETADTSRIRGGGFPA